MHDTFLLNFHKFLNVVLISFFLHKYYFTLLYAGEDETQMYLSGLRDCLSNYKEYSANVSENACPVIFDSWNCWPAAEPGTVQEQPCPNFPHLGFSPTSILLVFQTKTSLTLPIKI